MSGGVRNHFLEAPPCVLRTDGDPRIRRTCNFSRRLRDGVPPLLRTDPPALAVYLAVSDADMLEAVGATGTLRTFMFQACHGTGTDAALEHVRTKLLRCKDLFTDEWAASEATTRTARMVRICDEYEQEQRVAGEEVSAVVLLSRPVG